LTEEDKLELLGLGNLGDVGTWTGRGVFHWTKVLGPSVNVQVGCHW